MPRSLRQRRWDAFLQLDRITVRRRDLLARWFKHAVVANKSDDGTYYGMTMPETLEVERTINDLRQFCIRDADSGEGHA
jgi:hypothetical protein